MKLKKQNWEKVALGKLTKVDWGNTNLTKSSYIEEGSFLAVSAAGMDGRINHSEHKIGTTVLSAIGANCGVIFYPTENFTAIKNTITIAPINAEINDRFLFYSLINNKFPKRGTAQPFISKKDIEAYEILLPPLEEQKQIAALFQSIENAIVLVDGQEKNLHQLKHKLLKDLFSEKQEFGNHLKVKDFESARFEKIAFNISERVEPKKTELTTYVGLEHLDANNLKIERTGTPDDVIGTKLKIFKGDIIFGKRRAYLRKVAVSHFDGIASAHSMILRANEKNIEKDFLPYFMQSDTFMNRAVQISEGSLSPTIKNKTLAIQEFVLPKKEKQKELISIFKQFDETRQQLKQQKVTLKLLKQKLLNDILG